MIMFKKHGELTEEDLNEDPLIVLSCGHAFQMSTLDGHMGLTEFYSQDRFGRFTLSAVEDCHSLQMEGPNWKQAARVHS